MGLAQRRPRRKPWRFLLAVAGCVLCIALLWQGLLLAVAWLFPEPAAAGYGTIEVGARTQVVFCRQEQLIAAAGAGNFRPSLDGGQRVPRLGVIGMIKHGRTSSPCRAPQSGLVAFTADGLETVLTPAGAQADPEGCYRRGLESREKPTAAGRVRPGQPVARLIRDEEQYLLAELRQEHQELRIGQTVWLRRDEALIPAVLVKVAGGKARIAILRTERFPVDWLGQRACDLFLVASRHTGTLVPRRLLRKQAGQTGVQAVIKGRTKFIAVQVLGWDRDNAVVKGISEGTCLMPR